MSKKLEVRKSTGKGFGVFCTSDIKIGEVVIVSKPVMELPNRTAYSVQVDWNKHILTDKPAYFVNHSCDPTAGVKPNNYGSYDFVTRKNLLAGSEITVCYSTTEYEIVGFSKCFCGSRNCLKKITGWKKLSSIKKENLYRRRLCRSVSAK